MFTINAEYIGHSSVIYRNGMPHIKLKILAKFNLV